MKYVQSLARILRRSSSGQSGRLVDLIMMIMIMMMMKMIIKKNLTEYIKCLGKRGHLAFHIKGLKLCYCRKYENIC